MPPTGASLPLQTPPSCPAFLFLRLIGLMRGDDPNPSNLASCDRAVATAVCIPTVEEDDAKRIERERKNLVEERTRIVGRIKGLLAMHGIWLSSKRSGKELLGRLKPTC